MKFKLKNPRFEHLHKQWTAKHHQLSSNIVDKHLKHIALGSLGGLMFLGLPSLVSQPHNQTHIVDSNTKNEELKSRLEEVLPKEVRKLNRDEEDLIKDILSNFLGVPVLSEIKGIKLNRTYGLIGGEQHLYRYPGDSIFAHAKSTQDWAMYGSAGIAPHLGAWGYFSPSRQEFSKNDEMKERYYLAVQTFLTPGFAENPTKFRDFFRYRKMLVVNPKTGQSVVAVIADAGPSEWTGKHLGGSPEVMHALGLAEGGRKGEVLYFFIMDREKEIPLGPVKKEGEII